MRVIAASAISSLTASSAAAAYPVTNLQDSSPKRPWQAATSSVTYATLDVRTTGVTGALALIGVVADSVYVRVVDPTGIVWGASVTWPEVVWDTSPGAMAVTYETVNGDGYQNIWVAYPQFDSPVTIRVELRKNTGNPATITCGVLQCGQPLEFPGILYPLGEGLEDYSVFHQLSNGATYIKQRDRVRVFSGQMRIERDTYWDSYMRDLARIYGGEPLLYHLAPPWGDSFVIYARLSAMPSGSHDYPTHSVIGFNLTEVL